MHRNPGGSSYDNTPSGQWEYLGELMQFVHNIYYTLDDATQHAIFNDGTMRSFVRQLQQVREALRSFSSKHTKRMDSHLRQACDHLNRAGDEYIRSRRRTDTFYGKKNAALDQLWEVLNIWNRMQGG